MREHVAVEKGRFSVYFVIGAELCTSLRKIYILILRRYTTMYFRRKLTYNKALDMYSVTLPRTFVDGFLKDSNTEIQSRLQ